MRTRCEGTNRQGQPCGMAPVEGGRFCFAHHPAKAAARAQARKKGGRARQAPEPTGPAPEIRSVAGLQTVMERTVAAELAQPNSSNRNRTLGYLLGIAAKLLEAGELEARIEALEARLGGEQPTLEVMP